MKRNIFHSFRWKLVAYAGLSILLTILADVGLLALWKAIETRLTIILSQREGGSSAMQLNRPPVRGIFGMELPPYIWIILIVVSILLFLLFYIIFTAPLVMYFREILKGVERIKNGDLETELPIRYTGELGELGNAVNAMRIELDNTRRKDAETEHRNDELITNVAHDLRTPLTSVIGYLDLLRTQEELPEDVRNKYIDIAYRKSARMEGLVTDLFDFTRYKKNKVTAAMEPLEMRQFMEQVMDEFYPSFVEQGLNCYSSFSQEPVYIDGDGELLSRAFCNLMGNAVKYGAEGKQIWVEVENRKEQGIARIAITNYGRIIPAKELQYIFDKFYRGDSARSTTGGTGLGLAIAKNIITMHDGEITAHSSERGTVFEVLLPLAKRKDNDHEK
ncbi:MAG: HAMP domain-containing histidine kinase [Lachnospiraceae bacterium]|nr:HAMP domain-containing histidine kinase [Lachnospiraceae bacterium]